MVLTVYIEAALDSLRSKYCVHILCMIYMYIGAEAANDEKIPNAKKSLVYSSSNTAN